MTPKLAPCTARTMVYAARVYERPTVVTGYLAKAQERPLDCRHRLSKGTESIVVVIVGSVTEPGSTSFAWGWKLATKIDIVYSLITGSVFEHFHVAVLIDGVYWPTLREIAKHHLGYHMPVSCVDLNLALMVRLTRSRCPMSETIDAELPRT